MSSPPHREERFSTASIAHGSYLGGLAPSGLRYPAPPEEDLEKTTLLREPEASFLANPLDPKLRIEESWCAPAWPQAEPEWLRFYKLDAAHRSKMQQQWTLRLRVLLPEALSAPSAARRETLWQRMAAQQLDGEYDEQVPIDVLASEIERLCQIAGLFERQQAGQVTGRHVLFLTAALKAAADEVCGAPYAQRRQFRLLLMRMHQYLDVHTLLPEIAEPHHKVSKDLYERLLKQRRHQLKLHPTDKEEMTVYGIFSKLSVPGEPDVHFDRLARWSMIAQLVRPGSGAAVKQKRWYDHQIDPSTAGVYGAYSSMRSRDPKPAPHSPKRPKQPPSSSSLSKDPIGALDDEVRSRRRLSSGASFAKEAGTSLSDDNDESFVTGSRPGSGRRPLTARPRLPAGAVNGGRLDHHVLRKRPEKPKQRPLTPRSGRQAPPRPRRVSGESTAESEGGVGGDGDGSVSVATAASAGAETGEQPRPEAEPPPPPRPYIGPLQPHMGRARVEVRRPASAGSAAWRAEALAAAQAAQGTSSQPGGGDTSDGADAESYSAELARALEKRAKAAARAAARRVAAAGCGNPMLPSRSAGTTIVSAASAAQTPAALSANGGGESSSANGTTQPVQGRAQLLHRAQLTAAGGALVARHHTGRVVPASCGTPLRERSSILRGRPSGGAPPSSRHVGVGWGEWGTASAKGAIIQLRSPR